MRLTAFALFIVAVAVLLVGCGGSGTSTTVLEPTDPSASGLYISITAPSPVVDLIAHYALGRGAAVIVVSKPQGPQVCSYRTKITEAMTHSNTTPAEAGTMSKYVGQPITLVIYGTNPEIPTLCKGFSLLPAQ